MSEWPNLSIGTDAQEPKEASLQVFVRWSFLR